MQRSIPFNKYTNNSPIEETLITDEIFFQLKEKIFKKRPQLRNVIKQYGNLSLYEYAKRYNRTNTTALNDERKKQFIDTYTKEVERLLGKDVAQSCKEQLAVTYRMTTSDHHGPLSEPNMISSNIHEALPYLNGDAVV